MIPDKIKICGIDYVVRQDCDRELSCASLDGEIRYGMQEIVIKSNYQEQYKEQIFTHEFVHGIFDAIGRADLRRDEVLVEAFSQMLYQVLKDNKLSFGN